MNGVTLLKIILFYSMVISFVLAQEKTISGSLNQIDLGSNRNEESNHIYQDSGLGSIIILESLNKTFLDYTISNLTMIDDNFTLDYENFPKNLQKLLVHINNCTIALNNFNNNRFGKGIFEQSRSVLYYTLDKIFKNLIRDNILISVNLNNVNINYGNETYYFLNEHLELNQNTKENLNSRYLDTSHDVTANNDPGFSDNICQYFADCFNCTVSTLITSSCEWTASGCQQTYNPSTYNNWWDYFDVCYQDTSALNEMTTYCGDFSLQSPPYSAGLLDVGGSYGTPNLFCKWIVNNDGNYKNLFLNYTVLLDTAQLLTVEIDYLDGSSSIYNPHSQNFYFTAQNALNIKVYLLTYYLIPSKPFIVSFSVVSQTASDPNYIGLGISIGTILLIAMLCVFLLFKCSRIIMEQRNRTRNIDLRNLNNINILNEQQRIEELRKRNMGKLEILYTTELMPMTYDFNLNDYHSNCTICLEEFKMNAQVMKFSCKHLFHYSCGKSWCEKNILNLKCPNCNLMIIAEDTVEGPENNILILNDDRINNANNNMINLPEQNVRIVTQIIDTQPRIGGGVQFSQNMNIQIYNTNNNPRPEDRNNIELTSRNNYVFNYETNAEMLGREN